MPFDLMATRENAWRLTHAHTLTYKVAVGVATMRLLICFLCPVFKLVAHTGRHGLSLFFFFFSSKRTRSCVLMAREGVAAVSDV